MKLIDYYAQEIRYFLDEAHRFAGRYPDQAKALNLEEVRERDPYVERLIEAFAFLSGNIQKRLDDDFSNLAQELIETLWPHYLSPLPGALIFQFTPVLGRLKKATVVSPGAQADSHTVSTGLPCRFTTTSEVIVRPLEIRQASMVGRRDGRSALRICLAPMKGASWSDMGTEPVRIYLHGDTGFAFSLYYILLQDTEDVVVRYGTDDEQNEIAVGARSVSAVGLDSEKDAPLLSYPMPSFPGFRLLEEYFFFPEKYRFVDLDFLSALDGGDPQGAVEVDFVLTGRNDWRLLPDASAFRLHCTPGVNRYAKSAEPIHVEDALPYNKIIVDQAHPYHHVPLEVTRVEGIRLEQSLRHSYTPFLSYEHEMDGREKSGYYHIRRQVSVDDVPELLLGIHRPMDSGPEIVSLDLICSNGRSVREVKAGDVRHPGENLPDSVSVSNLTTPKAPAWPSLEGRELWTLVHHLSLNYLSLDDPERFRALLAFYDREKTLANQRRVAGLTAVKIVPAEILFKGFPLRGVDMEITLDEGHFTGQGDLLMFAHVLSRVMAMYVPINSFCNLCVRELNSENVYTWPGIKGCQAIV